MSGTNNSQPVCVTQIKQEEQVMESVSSWLKKVRGSSDVLKVKCSATGYGEEKFQIGFYYECVYE